MGDFRIDDFPSQTTRHRTRWVVFGVLMFFGLAGFGIPGSDRLPKTCAVCRLDRVDYSCLWIGWSVEEQTDCSRWYAAEVEPTHAHVWASRGRCRAFGFFGLGGVACYMGGPITRLTPSQQIEIYQQFEDRLEAKALFIRMMRDDRESEDMRYALMRWEGEGYPGTWPDWWEKHRGDAN